VQEARAPEPHPDREQTEERQKGSPRPADPSKAEIDEDHAQADPQRATKRALHDFEEVLHDCSSVSQTFECNCGAVVGGPVR